MKKNVTVISLKNLMILERLLLEIDERFKFELNFNMAYVLNELLEDVGKITSYAFSIQQEFHKKYNDGKKLEKYHDMVMDSSVEFNCEKVVEFIEMVDSEFKNEEFKNIVKELKFW